MTRKRPRKRRTDAGLNRLFAAVVAALASEDAPPTKRRLFYLLVVAGVLEKTERAYHQLCSHTTNWCRAKRLSWGAFDGELDVRGDGQYHGRLEGFLGAVAQEAQKDLWYSQDVFVTIIVEKAGIANIILSAVGDYRVPVVSLGGFEGDIALFKLGQVLELHVAAGRAIHIGYFGDWDPAGILIDRAAAGILRAHHGIDMRFERLAVTKEQIEELQLPTRPTKREKNRHAKNFVGESVEVDAVPTATLRQLARDFVLRTIDLDRFNAAAQEEDRERERVLRMLKRKGGR
jgi:hypothetical protein